MRKTNNLLKPEMTLRTKKEAAKSGKDIEDKKGDKEARGEDSKDEKQNESGVDETKPRTSQRGQERKPLISLQRKKPGCRSSGTG